MFRKAFNTYNHYLKTAPFATNFFTTGFLFGAGDVIAKYALPSENTRQIEKSFDYNRTARAVFYGSVIFSPIGNKWMYFLQRKVHWPGKSTSNSGLNTVSKVLVDQLLFAPASLVFYFSTMTIMEHGLDTELIKKKLHNSGWSSLLTNWCVWPFIQLFNFKYVKVQHRLLMVNVIAIFWNTFLSFKNNNG